jgi:putative RecB family exonuclease
MSGGSRPAGAGQQELFGMPEPLYACTPTRLGIWRDCPRRYRFSYLDRPQPAKGAPWAHNSIGAAVHSALADWWTLPPARRSVEAGAALVRRRWLSDGFRDRAQSAATADRAVEWVRTYLSDVDPTREPVGVERSVSTTTSTLILSGRVDRIDDRPGPESPEPPEPRPGGGQADQADQTGDDVVDLREGPGLVIVDYKTGRHVPTEQDARSSLALAVYALATGRTLRRPCTRVELHHLPSRTRAVAQHTAADLARKVAEAEELGAGCARADAAYRDGDTGDAAFAPRPSAGCSWCDFRRHCPEGRAAAPDRDPWASVLG